MRCYSSYLNLIARDTYKYPKKKNDSVGLYVDTGEINATVYIAYTIFKVNSAKSTFVVAKTIA